MSPCVQTSTLGIVGFHCLAGYPPFDGPTPMAILYKQAHESPPSLQKLGLNLSPEICGVLHKAMAKNPRERHATARDFAEALARPVRNRKRSGSIVGIVMTLIAAGLLLVNTQTAESEKTKATQPALDLGTVEVSKSPSPEPAREPVPVVVTVEINAGFPEEIQLALENGETVPTPYSIEAEQDSASREIRAFAKGFEDKTLTISFEKECTARNHPEEEGVEIKDKEQNIRLSASTTRIRRLANGCDPAIAQ